MELGNEMTNQEQNAHAELMAGLIEVLKELEILEKDCVPKITIRKGGEKITHEVFDYGNMTPEDVAKCMDKEKQDLAKAKQEKLCKLAFESTATTTTSVSLPTPSVEKPKPYHCQIITLCPLIGYNMILKSFQCKERIDHQLITLNSWNHHSNFVHDIAKLLEGNEQMIVFTVDRKRADKLQNKGLNAIHFDFGFPASVALRILTDFEQGKFNVLVVWGLGILHAYNSIIWRNVRYMVYELSSEENYIVWKRFLDRRYLISASRQPFVTIYLTRVVEDPMIVVNRLIAEEFATIPAPAVAS